jgi:hypothetical protein
MTSWKHEQFLEFTGRWRIQDIPVWLIHIAPWIFLSEDLGSEEVIMD